MDAALVFDNDETFEWVIGTMIQVESQPAIAINLKVRLVKALDRFDICRGWPSRFIVPFRRLGFEIGAAASSRSTMPYPWLQGFPYKLFSRALTYPMIRQSSQLRGVSEGVSPFEMRVQTGGHPHRQRSVGNDPTTSGRTR